MRLAQIAARTMTAASVAVASAGTAADWNFAFNQGTAEYSLGSFEADGNSLSLSCSEGAIGGDSVAVHIRRAGFTPVPQTPVVFIAGSRRVVMFTDADGFVHYPNVAVAPRFRALWRMIRTGKTLGVRFGPGAPLAFPLGGAAKLLGPVPCPKQMADN